MKEKTIIIATLGLVEFLRVSHYKSVKEIWDTFQVTHGGTTELKSPMLNTFTHKYELFRLKPENNIYDMQKRFTYIVIHMRIHENFFKTRTCL